MILVFAAIGVYQLVRRRWSDAAWTACAIGLPITTGLPGGIPRFFAVVYPASFALAEATRDSPRARILAVDRLRPPPPHVRRPLRQLAVGGLRTVDGRR